MATSELDRDVLAPPTAPFQPPAGEEELCSAPTQTTASQNSVKVDSMCTVCEKSTSKYKCPRCYIPYCSVSCNKLHRETHAHDPEMEPESKSKPQSVAAPQTTMAEPRPFDPNNPFHTLEKSAELKHLFKKYPRLPGQLLQIHTATLAPPTEASRLPASLLKDLPASKTDEWDSVKAIASGKAALRQARKAEGEDGKAIREYSELVLHLTNKAGAGKR